MRQVSLKYFYFTTILSILFLITWHLRSYKFNMTSLCLFFLIEVDMPNTSLLHVNSFVSRLSCQFSEHMLKKWSNMGVNLELKWLNMGVNLEEKSKTTWVQIFKESSNLKFAHVGRHMGVGPLTISPPLVVKYLKKQPHCIWKIYIQESVDHSNVFFVTNFWVISRSLALCFFWIDYLIEAGCSCYWSRGSSDVSNMGVRLSISLHTLIGYTYCGAHIVEIHTFSSVGTHNLYWAINSREFLFLEGVKIFEGMEVNVWAITVKYFLLQWK